MVIVACNTSSALALSYLKKTFSLPLLGVVEAGVQKAVWVTKNKRIGVIGTRSTITSNSYQDLIYKREKKAKIYSQACPLFVPLAEEAFLKGDITDKIIRMYLARMKRNNIDTIILGCTHYPLLKSPIAKFLRGVYIVDSAKEVARSAKNLLMNENIGNPARTKGTEKFYVTDEPKGFSILAKLFLKRKISRPSVIHV
jgi:glutamate racemase